MRIIAIILAALCLTACASSPTDTRSDIQKSLDALNIGYMVAAVSIDACVAAAVTPCDNPDVVTQIRLAENSVYLALVSAEKIAKTAGSDASELQKSVAIAREALSALTAILAQYRVPASEGKGG